MIRIGAVSYLNTKPLIHGLRERLSGFGELSLNLPSRLAQDLSTGSLDVALIPSVEYFRSEEYRIVSDAVIACRGPVWSVRLLSRVPAARIRRLALDEGSRTSAALLKILLNELHGIKPETIPLAIEQTPESADADAVLVIGDRAMHPELRCYQEIWDLGDHWCRWMKRPFVFAMWVAGPSVSSADRDRLARILEDARDDGLASLESIAARESGAHGLTKQELHRYFADNLHFQLGELEQQGLELFRAKANLLGLTANARRTVS